MRIQQIIQVLEDFAPKSYQESYDNCGIQIGNTANECTGVLSTLDVTEAVVDEAIALKHNLIVAHHPLLFSGVKRITPDTDLNRCIIKAIQNNITIYAIHTNLDNAPLGVSYELANLLGLKNLSILAPKSNTHVKLIFYTPLSHKTTILEALYSIGVGEIGNYKECSFSSEGLGTFTPHLNANPFEGKLNEYSKVKEERVEVLVRKELSNKAVDTLKNAHPYEEVAYELLSLENKFQTQGAGYLGDLEKALTSDEFLNYISQKLELKIVKHTHSFKGKIQKVALCGGSGAFLLKEAQKNGCKAYISADFKYHEYFDAEDNLLIADIGHFESEKHTKNLIKEVITKKIPNIVVTLSKINTNPIGYYTR
jgi:dinuclear metal center YbgI/SA1388 family protein